MDTIENNYEKNSLNLLNKYQNLLNYLESTETLKASEVMAILRISRETLCNYVKKGLIVAIKKPSGKQYLYDKQSVLNLVDKIGGTNSNE